MIREKKREEGRWMVGLCDALFVIPGFVPGISSLLVMLLKCQKI